MKNYVHFCMFVPLVLREINHTYRLFLFVLVTSVLSMSFVAVDKTADLSEKEKVTVGDVKEKVPSEQETKIEQTENQAVVPAVKLDLQKIAVLFREINFQESRQIHQFTEQKIILPKLLQTLYTTAIQKNAP